MRVLLDTNINLDFFLGREPFFEDASQLFDVIAITNPVSLKSSDRLLAVVLEVNEIEPKYQIKLANKIILLYHVANERRF